MELSLLLAKLYGAIFISLGLGMLINPDYAQKAYNKMADDAALAYLGGAASLVIGILIAEYHNIWTGSWVVIITIFGWIALIKGILLLTLPKSTMELSKNMFKSKNQILTMGLLSLILGLILGYFGFIA